MTFDPLLQRLSDKTQQSLAGCWQWRGYTDRAGYGTIKVDGRMQKAHRVMYAELVGPVPAGLELDHLCRNRSCVRPEHLEPVTRQENCLRRTRLITHCPAGHAYGEDTYVNSAGHRFCRACHRSRRIK